MQQAALHVAAPVCRVALSSALIGAFEICCENENVVMWSMPAGDRSVWDFCLRVIKSEEGQASELGCMSAHTTVCADTVSM